METTTRGTPRIRRAKFSTTSCSVAGCKKPHVASGYCRMHYGRWKKTGDPGPAGPLRISGRLCSVSGCGRQYRASGYCSMHLMRVRKTGQPGGPDYLTPRAKGSGVGYVSKQGYRIVRDYSRGKGRYATEHQVVMERTLGRQLRKGESVHHKNGDRLDNRPENLELWVTAHPSGQRVIDRINDAIETLLRYTTDDSLWGCDQEHLRMAISAAAKRYKQRTKKCKSDPQSSLQPVSASG